MKRIGKELSINEEIRAREVRVVSDTNEQLGVMTLHEAIRLSEEKGLDLVEVEDDYARAQLLACRGSEKSALHAGENHC